MSWKSSKPDSPRELPSSVVVAEVRRPHGLQGEVAVTLLSDIPDRLGKGSELDLVLANGERRQVVVQTSRTHKDSVVVRLSGVEDRDSAEGLRGARLEVSRELVPTPPEGNFYYFNHLVAKCCTTFVVPVEDFRSRVTELIPSATLPKPTGARNIA